MPYLNSRCSDYVFATLKRSYLKFYKCIKIVFDVYRKEKKKKCLYFFDWEAQWQCASLFRTGTLQTVTFGGHWQLKVTWSQHYMSLSRHFGVSSINQSSSTQCRKKTPHSVYLWRSQRRRVFQRGKKTLFLVTEHWVWAKMMVFQSAQTTSALHRHHKDGSERSCRIVFTFYARHELVDVTLSKCSRQAEIWAFWNTFW